MKKMTNAEYRDFIMLGTRTGKLATVRADGRSHVAPIWFVLDGDDLLFTTWHESVKARNLRRDNRASLCVDEAVPPYAFAIVEGAVTLSEDPEALAHWAQIIAARYMGAARAVEFGQRNSVPGELLVRLTPTKIIAQWDVSGY